MISRPTSSRRNEPEERKGETNEAETEIWTNALIPEQFHRLAIRMAEKLRLICCVFIGLIEIANLNRWLSFRVNVNQHEKQEEDRTVQVLSCARAYI